MIVLAAADTLAGVASSASKLTCTIFGMQLSAGTETYQVLDQRQLASSAATIYTVPALTTAFVRSITVVNTDTAVSYTFQLFRGGTAATNAITPVITIPAGGSANYEDGDGWQVLNADGSLRGVGASGLNGTTTKGLYGDGSDGVLDFTAAGATTAGATRSSTTYTATRDIFASSMTVESGVTLNMAQFRLFCTGTLTNLGIISCDGGAAVTSTAGAAQTRGSIAPSSGAGGAGVTTGTTTVAGSAASTSGSTTVLFAPGKVLGSGGNGGAGGNAGNAGATLNSLALGANIITPRDLLSAILGTLYTTGNSATTGPTAVGLCGGSGGSGGNRTAGTTATVAGGGGGGGGVLVISARTIANGSGIIRANGGAGAAASGVGDCVTGGGGGGGGGCVILSYDTITAGTLQANGGAVGAGLNAAAAAGSGNAGVVLQIANV